MTTRRIELVDADDPRFVLLRVDRYVLIGILAMLVVLAGSLTYGVTQNIRDDHRHSDELRLLRKEVATGNHIIDNANATSRSNTELLRCAFLIEPDVKKTEPVLDRCIKRANFPERRR